MIGKILFDDGSIGNYIDNSGLCEKPLSIVKKDNKTNVALVKTDLDGNFEKSDNLLPKDYKDIIVSSIKDQRMIDDWSGHYRMDGQNGIICSLPNGKIEVCYFRNKHSGELKKLFDEKDDVIDFEEMCLLYSDFVADVFYNIYHSDKTTSLVHKDLKSDNSKLEYIASHAESIDMYGDNKIEIKKASVPDGKISYIYDFSNGKKYGLKKYNAIAEEREK